LRVETPRDPDAELARLERDLDDSRQQQAATAAILRVIANSRGDAQPVLDAIATNANRLIGGFSTGVFRFVGDMVHLVAFTPVDPDADAALKAAFPIARTEVGPVAMLVNGEPRQISDTEAAASTDPQSAKLGRARGFRSVLFCPLMRDGEAIGFVAVTRRETRLFADQHVRLLQAFADQAVIAIETARLFDDVQSRTRDLSESLQQQTATAEVLSAISSSLGELEPLFDTILEKATRVCGAKFGTMNLYDGKRYLTVAGYNVPPAYAEIQLNKSFAPHPKSGLGIITETKQPVHIDDIRTREPYREGHPAVVALSDLGGARTLGIVPMLKDDRLIGTLTIYRQEVDPFNDKQIALLNNFAQQAVIAIENNRLLKELRESLQQQTATAEVLKAISRSTFDLPAVLHALVETATRLCDADKGTITRQKDGVFYRGESYGFSDEFMEYVRSIPVVVDSHSATGRALLEGVIVHIPDVDADPEYTFREGQRLGDFRALLGVPMLREGVPVGVIALTRTEPRPFTSKQIDLASTFADQAAIAIENVRLFDEVQARTRDLTETLQQQTATSEVLQVISSSPGDLDLVFRRMLETATTVCAANFGSLNLWGWQEFSDHRELQHSVVSPGQGVSSASRKWARDSGQDSSRCSFRRSPQYACLCYRRPACRADGRDRRRPDHAHRSDAQG
jgi:GAF domain-containing protein